VLEARVTQSVLARRQTASHILTVLAELDDISAVNQWRVEEMRKAGEELAPGAVGARESFRGHVRSVEAAIIHTYQITAHRAIRARSEGRGGALGKNGEIL
jgi:hypothetical protein